MATPSEIAKVRRRIGDRLKSDQDTTTGNGTDNVFALRFNNVFNVQAQLDGVTQDPASYYLNGQAGQITFNVAPADAVNITISYSYAAYTDDDLATYVDEMGLGLAVVECLQELLADSARLYDYTQGQTKAQKSQVFDHLKDLLSRYDAASDTFINTDGSSMGTLQMGKRTNVQYRPESGIDDSDLSRFDPERILG